MMKVTKLLFASTAAVGLAACASNAPDELPPTPQATATPTPTTTANTGTPQPGSQAHFVNAVQGQNVIYFDTDRSNIDSTDQAALQSQAQYLAQYPNLRITVEGHCDERGTRDYNLALGERRANAAKAYLVSLGIASNRITTVSYGKERPVALASTPEAWSQNRRAVSVVIG